MLMTTSDSVPGREIAETLGLVTANSVRARNIGRDILATLKNITGGQIGAYRQLLVESRQEALDRLTSEAEALGADAIVTLRLSTAAVMQGAAEILVYGTAVKLR
ncbi:MAG: YbjQ family protein [Chloroflexota bacterium]|nr:YbjQ family protein [Chloroflexota bacterium]MCY3647174.1 YbjQ family protein [Chloroflexota bacterium]MDE2670293.1 YbjQ family protein [Chloroflexota bacterium]